MAVLSELRIAFVPQIIPSQSMTIHLPSRFKSFVLLGCLAGLLLGCATTKVEKSWTAEGTENLRFNKVFVLGLNQNDITRRLAEISVRNQITPVATVTSYEAIPDVSDLADKAKVLAAIKASGADGIVVLRLVYKDAEMYTSASVARPMEYQVFSGYYGTYYDVGSYFSMDRRSVGYDSIFGIETNIYDARTEKLLWSGQTKSTKSHVKSQDIGGLVAEVAETVAKELRSQKLIR
jgi:hypothetical protein